MNISSGEIRQRPNIHKGFYHWCSPRSPPRLGGFSSQATSLAGDSFEITPGLNF